MMVEKAGVWAESNPCTSQGTADTLPEVRPLERATVNTTHIISAVLMTLGGLLGFGQHTVHDRQDRPSTIVSSSHWTPWK
jgi:hypothetical protein